MNSLVFYAGPFKLNEFGAVSVITNNIFTNYNEKNIDCSIIGFGIHNSFSKEKYNFNHYDILPLYLRSTIFYRILRKIAIKYSNILFQRLRIYSEQKMIIIADKIAAKIVKNILEKDNNIDSVIGLSSMSLSVGITTKKYGKNFIIHSQWCHPSTQNSLVREGYNECFYNKPYNSKTKILRQNLEYDLADYIWCPSKFVENSLLKVNIPSNKLFVSYLGIDVKHFFANSIVTNEQYFTILFVGNICIQKGIHILFNAVKKLETTKRIKIILNGNPDHEASKLIDKFLFDQRNYNIEIEVSFGDPRRFLSKSSVFVLPSLHDAFGIVVLEAMAAGLPVIVSDNVGASELIKHKKNGYIFPSGNSSLLTYYLQTLLDDSKSRTSMGEQSKKIAIHFDVKKTSSNIHDNLP